MIAALIMMLQQVDGARETDEPNIENGSLGQWIFHGFGSRLWLGPPDPSHHVGRIPLAVRQDQRGLEHPAREDHRNEGGGNSGRMDGREMEQSLSFGRTRCFPCGLHMSTTHSEESKLRRPEDL